MPSTTRVITSFSSFPQQLRPAWKAMAPGDDVVNQHNQVVANRFVAAVCKVPVGLEPGSSLLRTRTGVLVMGEMAVKSVAKALIERERVHRSFRLCAISRLVASALSMSTPALA